MADHQKKPSTPKSLSPNTPPNQALWLQSTQAAGQNPLSQRGVQCTPPSGSTPQSVLAGVASSSSTGSSKTPLFQFPTSGMQQTPSSNQPSPRTQSTVQSLSGITSQPSLISSLPSRKKQTPSPNPAPTDLFFQKPSTPSGTHILSGTTSQSPLFPSTPLGTNQTPNQNPTRSIFTQNSTTQFNISTTPHETSKSRLVVFGPSGTQQTSSSNASSSVFSPSPCAQSAVFPSHSTPTTLFPPTPSGTQKTRTSDAATVFFLQTSENGAGSPRPVRSTSPVPHGPFIPQPLKPSAPSPSGTTSKSPLFSSVSPGTQQTSSDRATGLFPQPAAHATVNYFPSIIAIPQSPPRTRITPSDAEPKVPPSSIFAPSGTHQTQSLNPTTTLFTPKPSTKSTVLDSSTTTSKKPLFSPTLCVSLQTPGPSFAPTGLFSQTTTSVAANSASAFATPTKEPQNSRSPFQVKDLQNALPVVQAPQREQEPPPTFMNHRIRVRLPPTDHRVIDNGTLSNSNTVSDRSDDISLPPPLKIQKTDALSVTPLPKTQPSSTSTQYPPGFSQKTSGYSTLPTAKSVSESVATQRQINPVTSAAGTGLPSFGTTKSSTCSGVGNIGNPKNKGKGKAPVGDMMTTFSNDESSRHRYYSFEFQSALQNAVNISHEFAAAVDQLKTCIAVGTDSHLGKLAEGAKKLSLFCGLETRTIAILGDSGEGKSSLVNSLLHFPGIAKTGDIGTACTSVVTEYWQKKPNQQEPIAIEVEYLSTPEIDETLKEHLWSYRQFYLPGTEENTVLSEQYMKWQRESQHAWSVLEAAFKHQSAFSETFLRDMSDGAAERIEKQLVQWAGQLNWPSSTEGVWRSTANSADDCWAKAAIFMEDRYWPFIKIMRIYLDSDILKAGIVLADLPGLHETNVARVRSTLNYLNSCSNIFVVAKISRAITDQSLKSSLFSVIARHVPLEWEESAAKSLNIAVVCTRSEDIDIPTAKLEFGRGPNKRVSDDAVRSLEAKINAAKAADDHRGKKEYKRELEQLFIDARSEYVKEGLRKAYSAKAPGGVLDVFCVSNKQYGKFMKKGNLQLGRASGIPELRSFCYGITAEAKLQEAKHYMQSSLFTTLNSMDLWADTALASGTAVDVTVARTKKKQESRLELLRELSLTHSAWVLAIDRFESGFLKCFREQIITMIDNRHVVWKQAAMKEAWKWHPWHQSQYNAFCRNDGCHTTPKRSDDWNAKLIWKMRLELEFQWDIVQDEVGSVFDDLGESVTRLLKSLAEKLKGMPDNNKQALIRGIEARIEDFEYKTGLTRLQAVRAVKNTRRYVSESNYSSYIMARMLPSYRSAALQKGPGRNQNQIDIIEGSVNDGILFPNVGFDLTSRMETIIKDAKNDMLALSSKVTTSIRRDISIVTDDTPNHNVEHRSELDIPALGCIRDFSGNVKSLRERLDRILQGLVQ